MSVRTKIVAFTSVLLLPACLASAQAPPGSSVVSRYCLVNGRYVWLDGRTNCPASSSTSPTSSTVPSGANLGYGIGYAIGSRLTRASGSSNQQQRRDEEAKLAAETQARALEEERRRDELHRRLLGTLKLTGLTDLSVKGFDGRSDLQIKTGDRGGELALKTKEVPQGTSFFGQGGGPASRPSELLDDPKVVDLRNLQRAIVLLRSAPQLAVGDSDLILSEALNTANGDTAVLGSLPGDYAVPVISENGLLAFQQANIDYANARDWLLHRTRLFDEAQRRREIGERKVTAIKSEAEALDKAKRRLEDTERRAVVARTSTVKVLQSLAAGVEPPAPPATDAPWIEFQTRMLQARRDIDRSQARLLHEIDDLKVLPPQSYTRVREGVIGGMFTDAEWARQLASTGRSPFTGKLYSEMARQPGQSTSVVVSFGTPGQKASLLNLVRETERGVADHLTVGEFSLRTPQAQAAIAALAGKEFDRLIVHSNGTSVVQALLTHGGVMRVRELHIMGGDGSMANGPALQALLDSGAVNRIVVWRTVKDPIPIGTSPDQWLKMGQLSESFALRMVRQASGNIAAGDARVEYPGALVPPVPSKASPNQYFDFAHHDLQKAYYPAVAKKFGVPWSTGN